MGTGYPRIAKMLPTKSGEVCLCNLYSMTKPQQVVRDLARVAKDLTGNLPPLPRIFPDMKTPVVINRPPNNMRQMVWMRWGFPHAEPEPGQKPRPGYVTNVRH